jgi:hypothetical protein
MQVVKPRMIAALAAVLVWQAPGDAIASAPACYTYNGSGYCQYQGKVAQAYMNAYNEILLYFDTPANPSDVANVGITGVTNYGAARFLITNNPEFGKALMAALLSAQARGATITVQLWGTGAGYMTIDRFWVSE